VDAERRAAQARAEPAGGHGPVRAAAADHPADPPTGNAAEHAAGRPVGHDAGDDADHDAGQTRGHADDHAADQVTGPAAGDATGADGRIDRHPSDRRRPGGHARRLSGLGG
jgi:hypothetical protein